jgi:hypothetical protein
MRVIDADDLKGGSGGRAFATFLYLGDVLCRGQFVAPTGVAGHVGDGNRLADLPLLPQKQAAALVGIVTARVCHDGVHGRLANPHKPKCRTAPVDIPCRLEC